MTPSLFSFLISRMKLSSDIPFNNSYKLSKSRRGVSPVIATTIILAITVVLGLTLWSFANAGVSKATYEYAEVVTDYGEFTSDKFVIADIDFNNPSSNRIAFWVFNSGKTSSTVNNVAVICKDVGCTQPSPQIESLCQHDPSSPDDINNCLTKTLPDGTFVPDYDIPSKDFRKFSVDVTTIQSGTTYEMTIVSDTGALQTFMKRMVVE